jgi:hypothetical protein
MGNHYGQSLNNRAKRLQWELPYDFGENMMGALHLEMAVLTVLEDWVYDKTLS